MLLVQDLTHTHSRAGNLPMKTSVDGQNDNKHTYSVAKAYTHASTHTHKHTHSHSHNAIRTISGIRDSPVTNFVILAASLAPPLTALERVLSGFPSGSFS